MEIPIIILFSMENGKREHKIAFKAQPSDWAQPHRHPNSKSASSPLWIGMRQQWLIFSGGLTINWFFCNYTKEIPNFHTLILIPIQKGGIAAVFASIKGKIASSTATTFPADPVAIGDRICGERYTPFRSAGKIIIKLTRYLWGCRHLLNHTHLLKSLSDLRVKLLAVSPPVCIYLCSLSALPLDLWGLL